MSGYLEKLFDELNNGNLNLEEDGVNIVEVLHEDDCPFLNGKGFCTCDPDLSMKHVK